MWGRNLSARPSAISPPQHKRSDLHMFMRWSIREQVYRQITIPVWCLSFVFSGTRETTGVTGEGVRLRGGAHSSQSGGMTRHS